MIIDNTTNMYMYMAIKTMHKETIFTHNNVYHIHVWWEGQSSLINLHNTCTECVSDNLQCTRDTAIMQA